MPALNDKDREIDRLREVNSLLVEALKRGRSTLACAIKAAWQDSTDDDVSTHVTIKIMDKALAKAGEKP